MMDRRNKTQHKGTVGEEQGALPTRGTGTGDESHPKAHTPQDAGEAEDAMEAAVKLGMEELADVIRRHKSYFAEWREKQKEEYKRLAESREFQLELEELNFGRLTDRLKERLVDLNAKRLLHGLTIQESALDELVQIYNTRLVPEAKEFAKALKFRKRDLYPQAGWYAALSRRDMGLVGECDFDAAFEEEFFKGGRSPTSTEDVHDYLRVVRLYARAEKNKDTGLIRMLEALLREGETELIVKLARKEEEGGGLLSKASVVPSQESAAKAKAHEVLRVGWEALGERYRDAYTEILRYTELRGVCTIRGLVKQGLSKSTAKRRLKELEGMGLLGVVESQVGKETKYGLTASGRASSGGVFK